MCVLGMKEPRTENGAPSLATTSDARMDLFFKLVRNIPVDALVEYIDRSWQVDPLDTMKLLFQSRDCRGGKGDRKPFIAGMRYVARKHPAWFLANLAHVI